MGKENVNLNFNQSGDFTNLTTEKVEIKTNVSGPTEVANNTEGIGVKKVKQNQKVNQNIETFANETTKTKVNSKVAVNSVNTGETIKESKEDAGINHTQTAFGQNITTKREKMSSSSVENVNVSGETGAVGSYSDDAQNNGVFGIDAKYNVKPENGSNSKVGINSKML